MQVRSSTRRSQSCLSAVVLASLVLGVFYMLQYYGPESAIRRFIEAVRTDNPVELSQVSAPAEDRNRQLVYGKLRYFNFHSATMRIVQMERSPDQVRAALLFSIPPDIDYPDGMTEAMIWVVERRGRLWYVDVNKTATILKDSSGIL